ncbi:MAG: site-2 protease family protein [Candidatus Cohnella colombiensis]|uniref:Site-2 protease family protein n=1 Tax=Candidatus Cohnella colombiensis TaxID=3121368 RepID=A0AA95EUP1_9BACL|nr:MAG: site-2 protease family protein [Cohnella sp.]
MSFFWFPIEHLAIIVLVMLVAFTVHEFAHAWTAWKFGDDTAYREGRVTLNPMVHLDWIGMICLLLAGFGWAKPVPVRRSRFKKPRLMNILVTAAGPISNLLLAFIFMLLIDVLHAVGVISLDSQSMIQKINIFAYYWVHINLILFLFNLIPLPPLDGYRIVEEFLPMKIWLKIRENAQWISLIFLLIIFVPPLREVTLDPLFTLKQPILDSMVWVLSHLFSGSGGSLSAFFRLFW